MVRGNEVMQLCSHNPEIAISAIACLEASTLVGVSMPVKYQAEQQLSENGLILASLVGVNRLCVSFG
jgi:hypothetical protein